MVKLRNSHFLSLLHFCLMLPLHIMQLIQSCRLLKMLELRRKQQSNEAGSVLRRRANKKGERYLTKRFDPSHWILKGLIWKIAFKNYNPKTCKN